MSQQESYPNVAFVLSLIAGIFVLLGGLVVGAIGAILSFFAYGIGAVIGIFGIIWGIIIIVGAINLRAYPRQHLTWGIIILVFSIFSWFGGLGGFFIGFLLGLIGGILAIIWSPPLQTQAASSYAAPAYVAPAAPSSTARFCPNCGASVSPNTRFCRYCGKELP
jgi:hypothetical protein